MNSLLSKCCWSTEKCILKHFSPFGGLRVLSKIPTTFSKGNKILGGKRNGESWIWYLLWPQCNICNVYPYSVMIYKTKKIIFNFTKLERLSPQQTPWCKPASKTAKQFRSFKVDYATLPYKRIHKVETFFSWDSGAKWLMWGKKGI